jgi:hypothetical protein
MTSLPSRHSYDPVSTIAVESGDDGTALLSSSSPRNPRRPYNRLSHTEDDDDTTTPPPSDSIESTVPTTATTLHPLQSTSEGERTMTITILDFTQKKFPLSISPTWTVLQLKQEGAKVHKVAPELQRLVYRGRLLQDEHTLQEVGLIDEAIVHLFPKPRVVIKDSNSTVTDTDSNHSTNPSTMVPPSDDGGARIPTIFLDASEAEQRSSILVLGSTEYAEAQNNVKLFSFMLLMISTIELVTLLAIASGAPEENGEAGLPLEGDDIFTPSSNNNDYPTPASDSNSTNAAGDTIIYEHWQTRHWFDLLISLLGVYVALLGVRATNEHTLQLAKRYMYGVVITAIGWLIYNYVVTYQMDAQVAASNDSMPPMSDKDLRQQALSMMVLPGMVWFLCVIRAWHFQRLLQEAEDEATERIRSQAEQTPRDEETGVLA